MKVACVGGGPACLYFSILMKRQDPSHDITVYERNPAGSTYGWGVTYWGGMRERLHRHDPESARAVAEHSVCWDHGEAHVRDVTTVQPGDVGHGIGRRRMLDLLADRARELGVRIEYERPVDGGAPPAADLVVAGDGVNSALRDQHAGHFGTRVDVGRNKYIWLGTTKVFDSFKFAFVETDHGWIWCYGYPFSDAHSTCVVECSPETWAGLGLHRAGERDGLALLEQLFVKLLDGHALIGRASADIQAQWLNFRTITNRTWSRGNLVLMGDAAHTTHYSIGAGTTLALEDAIALAGALARHPGAPAPALAAYERERRSALLAEQSAARYSARWYENLPRYMDLPPREMFALLGQRHSPLLPYLPPRLYYRLDQLVERMEPVRRAKRWLGPRMARALHARSGDRG